MVKDKLFAERHFEDGKKIETLYGLEGEGGFGGLVNYSLKDLAKELRVRTGKEYPLSYSNYQDSEISVSPTGLEVKVILRTGLTRDELKELSKLISRNLSVGEE